MIINGRLSVGDGNDSFETHQVKLIVDSDLNIMVYLLVTRRRQRQQI